MKNTNSPRLHIASDSTAQVYTYDDKPMTGWGTYLPQYINLPIINHAIGGRSSKSFIKEGRLKKIEELLEPGDYLLVQFGHNDATPERPERYVHPNDYPFYIKQYITATKAKDAHCILLTPVTMRLVDSNGTYKPSHREYCDELIQIARQEHCPYIDYNHLTYDYIRFLSPKSSAELFLSLEPYFDNTHLSHLGAKTFASLLSEQLKKIKGLSIR